MERYISMYGLTDRMRYYRERFPPLQPHEISCGYIPRTLNRFLLTQETFAVPSKNTKTGNKRSGFTTTFVNYKLAGKEKDDFAEFFSQEPDTLSAAVVEALSQGLKLSFSDNRESGVVVAAATMRDEGNINYDRCITSRSPDWYEAMIMCVFKARLLGFGEDWLDQAGDDSWG